MLCGGNFSIGFSYGWTSIATVNWVVSGQTSGKTVMQQYNQVADYGAHWSWHEVYWPQAMSARSSGTSFPGQAFRHGWLMTGFRRVPEARGLAR